MTIIFPTRPRWLTFERLLIYGLLIAAVILWHRSCQGENKAQLAVSQAIKQGDSVMKELTENNARWIEERKEAAVARFDASVQRNLDKYIADSLQKIVTHLSKTSMRLSGEIIDLRNTLPDSTWVQVHPSYADYCDSLADIVPPLNREIRRLTDANIKKDAAYLKELALFGQEIDKEQDRTDSAIDVAEDLKEAFDTYVKKVSPRNSVWIGGEIGATPFTLLAGPQAAFQTKKGIQYQIGIGLDSRNSSYYGKAGILWKISFRK